MRMWRYRDARIERYCENISWGNLKNEGMDAGTIFECMKLPVGEEAVWGC